ncbi:hypothetical protein NI17_005340 [Thermobifida halotolerans]|uniref:PBS lyase n=1 Tax=Thermobifida halotolerans TaxID=483545 RepID=A0AA97LZ31_9ACTN|nr:hypothetical protein [Thermobifida halotolerans]UOE20641.1 hypothetical protein NI17_005340 [Thermobifida halotolerans]
MNHEIGWDAVADADWPRLFHAHGAAHDTPAHLRALVHGDGGATGQALDHLWSAVIHQGAPWPATAPAARVVAGVLAEESLSRLAGGPATVAPGTRRPLRAALLDFLAAVAEAGRPDIPDDELAAAAFPPGLEQARLDAALEAVLTRDAGVWREEAECVGALMSRALVDIRSAAPALLEPALACLDDAAPRVRTSAAHAAVATAALLGDGSTDERLASRIADAARRARDRDERACLVLALGDLGQAPGEFLSDPDPAVRACAALAPALAGDCDATEEILTALTDPTAADAWFTHRPPRLRYGPRFVLVEAALARVADFDRLLPAACAVAAVAHPFTVAFDWGPLLRAAFPAAPPAPAAPDDLTEAQRTYLRALVANERLWDGRIGNTALALRRVGLPEDRDACRRLASP